MRTTKLLAEFPPSAGYKISKLKFVNTTLFNKFLVKIQIFDIIHTKSDELQNFSQ